MMWIQKNIWATTLATACWLVAGSASADTCKRLAPMPEGVEPFVLQVKAAIRASLSGMGDLMFMQDLRDNKITVSKLYCAAGGSSPLPITIKAYFVGIPDALALENAKKAVGLIDLRRAEEDEARKAPIPANLQPEYDRMTAEMKELGVRHQELRKIDRNHPELNAVYQKRWNLGRQRDNELLRPHRDAIDAQLRQINDKYGPEIYKLEYQPSLDVDIELNGWHNEVTGDGYFLGTKASTNEIATKVGKVTVEFRGFDAGGSTEGYKTAALVLKERWLPELAKMVDRARLQALVDGNIPGLADSNALIAKQGEDMKLGKTRLQEANKRLGAAKSEERQRLAALKSGKPAAPVAAKNTEIAAKPEATAKAETAKPVAVVAPAPTAPAAPPAPAKPAANPAAILDGVNKLKGLFGR